MRRTSLKGDPLCGRAVELDELRRALERDRVIVVYGPAAVGKSALVERVLADREQVCWIELAGLAADDLQRRVSAGLRLDVELEVAAGPARWAAVVRALSAVDVVVLDGLDDSDQADVLTRHLLSSSIGERYRTQFLITSRRSDIVDADATVSVGPLCREDAVQLWRDTVAKWGGASSDAQLARTIVERVDRLPGQILWLAPRAAQVGEPTCLRSLEQEVAETAVLSASLAGLTHEDNALLRFLAPFEVGPTAAMVVDAGHGLDVLERLATRSLLRVEAREAGPTVLLYAPVRAAMRAQSTANWLDMVSQHAATVLAAAVVGTADPDRQVRELSNLREELWVIKCRFSAVEPERALRAAVLLAPLAEREASSDAQADELIELIGRAYPELPASTSSDRLLGDAALAVAKLLRAVGRTVEARSWLDVAGKSGVDFRVLLLLEHAHLDRMESRIQDAIDRVDAAVTLADESGEPSLAALAAGERGRLRQSHGSYAQAQRDHQRAVALSHAAKQPWREALERSLHARATHRAGRVSEAIPMHQEALAAFLSQGRRRLAAAERGHLAYCHHELDLLDEADAFFRESIEGLGAVGDIVLESIMRTLRARALGDAGRVAQADLELELAAAVLSDRDGARFPRLERTRQIVLGEVAWQDDNERRAMDAWQRAAELSGHFEVGFEALAPAYLAWARSAPTSHHGFVETLAALAGVERPALTMAVKVLSMPEQAQRSDIVDLARTSSDLRRVCRWARKRFGTMETPSVSAPVTGSDGRPVLVVARDGRTFRDIDTVAELGRRAAPRRLLVALTNARILRPGQTIGFDELIAAGWPGERMLAEAARKRLRTAVWTLRRMGLDRALLTRDDGYLFDPFLPVRWADP